MINVQYTSDKKHVVITIQGLGQIVDLKFYRDAASEIEAVLLQKHILEAISHGFKDIRRVSYLRGWRDAKSKKRKKEDWFPPHPTITPWERNEIGE